jgi:hypothetical protein
LNQILERDLQQDWTSTQHKKLESIDVELTKTLLKAEKQSSVPVGHSWSPTLDKNLIYNYWCIKIHSTRNNITTNQQLKEIKQQLPEEALHQQLTFTNLK